ncbi:Rieske (2Fe-2S) protein [Sulfuricaulis limicola]|uniref:Rieske (2Fe-2S) protein n=1 Tax=Sulfuricaulis limicola TaxID=1620215 RepID=UPI000BBA8822|nr:Rieske 2Fe-2S domain-containing protein [Sulfuricaulis limicola]
MAATGKPSIICRSRELVDRGRGIRFTVRRRGETTPAFVVRFDGAAHAYVNRCAHRSLELDWIEGDFFDAFGEHLLCATHGARYAPASGACVGGPCGGAGLVKLAVREENGDVLLEPGDDIHLIDPEAVT